MADASELVSRAAGWQLFLSNDGSAYAGVRWHASRLVKQFEALLQAPSTEVSESESQAGACSGVAYSDFPCSDFASSDFASGRSTPVLDPGTAMPAAPVTASEAPNVDQPSKAAATEQKRQEQEPGELPLRVLSLGVFTTEVEAAVCVARYEQYPQLGASPPAYGPLPDLPRPKSKASSAGQSASELLALLNKYLLSLGGRAESVHGWDAKKLVRQAGNTAGTTDKYFIAPNGQRFRSQIAVARYLGLLDEPGAGSTMRPPRSRVAN